MTAADPNIVSTIKGIAVLILLSGLPVWRKIGLFPFRGRIKNGHFC
jgi:hypothetical protein